MRKKFILIGTVLAVLMALPKQCTGFLQGPELDYDAILGDGEGSSGDGEAPAGEKPCIASDGRMNPLGGVLEVRRTGSGRPVETGLFRVGKDAVRTDKDGNRRNHTGIDLRAEVGTPVYAVADGVAEAGWTGYVRDYGNTVTIDAKIGGKDVAVLYAHLSKMTVKPGETVRKGQLIGYTGVSGNAAGNGDAHLHFEVRTGKAAGGKAVDPVPYLNGSPDMTTGMFLGIQCP